jgi:hypothetical protein
MTAVRLDLVTAYDAVLAAQGSSHEPTDALAEIGAAVLANGVFDGADIVVDVPPHLLDAGCTRWEPADTTSRE